MSESRTVPSGQVYRQLFEAQVQLSRSLLAGRKDTRKDCLSAEDSNTHCSTTSSRRQQVDIDDVADDVINDVRGLPDTLVVNRPNSDIIERMAKKKHQKHQEALKRLDHDLSHLSQDCEIQVRTISQQLLSSLQDINHRLDSLKARMEQLEHISLQEVYRLWEEVEEEMKLKKIRITELNVKLTESERRRTNEISAVLKTCSHLLLGVLPSSDVHRLIHTKATMLNHCLLANRRSVARLLLHLHEENLRGESFLRRHWEDCLSSWKRSRVSQVVDQFRTFCSSDQEQGQNQDQAQNQNQNQDQQLASVQQIKQIQQEVTEKRCDIINKICSLVPPTCSAALVSNWFHKLTAVNQEMDHLHTDLIHQLRCDFERTWQDRLVEMERCKEALFALQLSEDEVNEVVSSQLLPLIGRRQSEDEEQLAALDVCSDSAARHALHLTRCVYIVMQAAALLWEMHCRKLESRDEELQRILDDLRSSQQQLIQKRKAPVDEQLGHLRQKSSEDALKATLKKTVGLLQDLRDSYTQCVSDQWEVLDYLPSLFMEDLLSYSSSISSFFKLSHTYRPSPEDVEKLHPSFSALLDPGLKVEVKTLKPEEVTKEKPISCQSAADPAQASQDWLTEAESSLLELCDMSNYVTFTSSRGVDYSGPAFRCPNPIMQQETHLSLFPVELLTHTLSRTRILFMEHLEQQFHSALQSAVTMVTERKEAVLSEQNLQLQQLDPQHIQTHIYQPRLVELQLHQQRVDVHCEDLSDVLTSCRTELQELQASISRKNQEFTATLSNIETDVQTADSSQRLQALSSTLQDCVDEHIKDTQRRHTSFRRMVQVRLEEARTRTSQLLSSFRLFSEGGDFSPKEVKMFQKKLKDETRQIAVSEDAIYSELEAFESKSLQQVKEVSARLEEKLSVLTSEVEFTEKIQKMMCRTQVLIKAETASSDQQQSVISRRLEDLKAMLQNTQVSPDQVCRLMSSVSADLRRRCQYLDLDLGSVLQASLAPSSRPKSSFQVPPGPPPGLLQLSRRGVDFHDDPAVSIIQSLSSRLYLEGDSAAENEQKGRKDGGQSPVQRQQRITKSLSRMSGRSGYGSIRTERRFQIFGPKPELELSERSLSFKLNSVLWNANDAMLQTAEDFYQRQRLCCFKRFPDSEYQWAESIQQRLLGIQEKAEAFLSTSKKEVMKQLSELGKLLHSLPSVLIGNHERQLGAGLKEEVGGVRQKLEETIAASEKEKSVNVSQLRVSLRDDELQALNSREELRQQQLHSAICSTHLELQECVRMRGEEFVTSLSSLTKKLLHLLDDLLTPAETDATATHQDAEGSSISMATAETRSRARHGSSSSVTMATTASIPTAKHLKKRQEVPKERDAAMKRFEQLLRSESLRSDDDKQRQLNKQQCWNTHWRQQIHTLKHNTP